MLSRLRGLRGRLAVGCLVLLAFGLTLADITAYLALKRQIEQRDASLINLAMDRALELALIPGQDWTSQRLSQVLPENSYIALFTTDGIRIIERYPSSLAIESTPVVPSYTELPAGLSALRAPGASDGLVVAGRAVGPDEQVTTRLNGKTYPVTGVVAGFTDRAAVALLRQQATIQIVTALLILVLAGGAISLILRFGLAPLRDVAYAAREISAGDASRRIPVTDDRTEIGAVSQSLNDAFDHVEESETRMRLFVADASHELRTPLATIHGWADLYLHDGIGEWADVDIAMTRIRFEASRMDDLVEQLLTLARQDAGAPIRHDVVDLVAVCTDVVDSGRVAHPHHPIECRFETPVNVIGDETLLRQLVSNLVSNAARHTPNGTPVRVDLAREFDTSSVRLSVSDDGPGLQLEQLEHAFDRFWRANTGRGPDGGTGLGLSIVRSIALAHGGTATLESPPGSGLTVLVRLPTRGSENS